MKKTVTKKEIKRAVKEYIERTLNPPGDGTDEQIDCPRCGRNRAMEFDYHRGEWRCLWRDCSYIFPKELKPPTPKELEDYYNRQELEKRIKKFLE